MTALRCFVLTFSFVALGWSSGESPGAQQKRSFNPMVGLLESAQRLPFEYRADIQLNAIESPKSISIPKAKIRSVLEQLFRDAGTARFRYQQRDITRNQFSNSQRLDVAMASLRLDELSVRTRVISALLRIDSQAARHLFADFRFDIASSPCTSPMVADVSEYYLKLGAVVENGFSPTERNQGEDAKFLQQHIFPIVSPMQLVPAGNLIGKLPLRDEVVSALTFSYSDALSRLRATDRELGYLERDGSLRKTIEALVDRNSNQSGETLALLRAYRAFLTASAAGEACADHGADRKRIADLFNGMLVKHGEGHIKPLTVEELKFQSISDAERIDFIPNASEISGGLTKRLVAFRAAEEHAEQGVNPLSRSDWDADANDLLARADAFDASKGPCQVCLFQEKAELLFALFDLSPPDSTKERVLDHLAAFMADDPSQQDHPLEWLYRLKLLLNLARRASPDQVKQIEDLNKRIPRKVLIFLPSALQNHIWLAVGNQNNPLMQEYVVAERLLENQYVMPPYR